MTKFHLKKQRQISIRLNVLFLIVFFLFAALILRLGFVQIAQGDDYKKELTKTTNQVAHMDAPRGKMMDRYGNVLVDNELELSLTYTRGDESPEDMLKLAQDVVQFIELDTSKVRERDQREYYYTTLKPKERKELLPNKKDLEPEEEYRKIIKAIPDEVIEGLSDEENKVAITFGRMSRGMTGEPQRIKQDLTKEEAHRIAEQLDMLPNMDLQRDASRAYVYGSTFKQVYGRVGQIPIEDADSYLAKGYKRSDYVGTSYLEEQYEDVLRGKKAEIVTTFTREGNGPGKSQVEEKLGSRGSDLQLTIDMSYQQKLDEAVKREVEGNTWAFIDDPSAYVVVMDPKTGDILAMSGYKRDRHTGEGYHNELGVMNSVFAPGSVVKGASVLTGFETDAMSPGQGITDAPLRFKGTEQKKSWKNLGWVSHLRALEQSSNVYMFHIAMNMAGYHYSKGKTFISKEEAEGVLDQARYYFSQFGLGTETGIDVSPVSSGYIGQLQENESGKLLDFMIGQYDNYSVLQLGQYVSTIANDGVRMRPRFVKSIIEPTPKGGSEVVEVERSPEMLNRVDMNQGYITEVQKGFRLAVTNGTAKVMKQNASISVAAKTGTAQIHANGQEGYNISLVGYAPYEDPEIAFAIIVPNMQKSDQSSPYAQNIGAKLVNDYFDLKEKRKTPEETKKIVEEADEISD